MTVDRRRLLTNLATVIAAAAVPTLTNSNPMLASVLTAPHDVLVMTFEPSDGSCLSNHLNPFITDSSDSLTQMVASLMEDDNDNS